MSPEENEVKLVYPIHKFNFTDLEDAKNNVVGIKLEKFADGYHVILAVLEDGKTNCLTTLNNFHDMLEILQNLEDMTARIKYEEKAKEPVHFENEGIIIIDPCYIMKKGTDDWGGL